ncbi:hypothetical protein ABZ733_30585 [Streptomyces longwoodensis]|uniref:DUF6924 domain-containing protein n=1 Tax=Streptomyces longwoodensis TaxID=68231 RepID=UPI0033DBCAC0
MDALPEVNGRGDFDALVVRTYHRDDLAWRDVVQAVREPRGDGACEAHVHFVDDPAWTGAGVEQVLSAVRSDPDLPVVFPADETTLRSVGRPLLAVTTLTREACSDEKDLDRLTEYGVQFRIAAAGVHDVHANLSLGNLGFEEYAACAHDDPEGISRPL